MNRFDLEEFRSRRTAFDLAVDSTPGICRFCSATSWQLNAHDHLHETGQESRQLIRERDGNWLLFGERDQRGLFLPLEAAWMFGCPLAGDPESATSLLCEVADHELAERSGNTAFVIGGLVRGEAMHQAVTALRNRSRVWREFPGTHVMLIDLEDGIEAWWERRSRKFKRSLRTGGAIPEEDPTDGVEIIDVSGDPPAAIFERLLAIQRQTYKWREGTDIFQIPAYTAFYRELLHDLHDSGGLRVLVARREGIDLAHIFGGVRGTIYRGLQMSYIEEARDLGLGNRLQFENLRRRAAEGVLTYDLGMHAPYKERWADRLEERVGVLWMG